MIEGQIVQPVAKNKRRRIQRIQIDSFNVFSPAGAHLGTIKPPEDPANCGWGDDGRTLYITAETGLYRIKTSVMGQAPVYSRF